MSRDPNPRNPFSDDPAFWEQSKSSHATMVVVVLAVVFGTLILMCGGIIAGGVFLARQVQRDFDVAFGDIEDNPFRTDADLSRYHLLRDSGRYEEALVELEKALADYPDDAVLHNEKSWMLATCPVDAIRDGKLAVQHATRACELTDWRTPEFVDTLAAAHAEVGDFEAAVKRQREAISLGPSDLFGSGYEERLAMYQAGRPYRQGVEMSGTRQPEPASGDAAAENTPAVAHEGPAADAGAAGEPAKHGSEKETP